MNREYELKKERATQRESELSRLGRDIGDIPPVQNSARKARALRDFRFFCKKYFPHTFTKPWSPDHLKIIKKIEFVVLLGGLFAMALPRAGGKTKLCETGCIWAILTGKHLFVMFVGASDRGARRSMRALKTELRGNPQLLADFPEVVYPIHVLEGQARRCIGQLHHGQPTHIGWNVEEIVLPTIPGSRASGAVVKTIGIEGGIRGEVYTMPNGTTIRPTLVVIDDPQTDESAKSVVQCQSREATVTRAVLGLAGPGEKIAAMMPCTVIAQGDMADRILDPAIHPAWQGERTKMVYKWPDNMDLWNHQYRELWHAGMDASPQSMRKATAFYRKNRKAMDAGSEVAWPARRNSDELSALQHAMNIRFERGDPAFFAEYQNDPLPEFALDDDALKAEDLAERTNNHKRGVVPNGVNRITAFIDIQQKALYWVVAGWEDNCTGAVLDYGIYPDQKSDYVTLRNIQRTLSRATPGAGIEGAWYSGLGRLGNLILAREWKRDDGTPLRIELCLIDCAYAASTDVVYRFCRESPHSAVLLPSRGTGITAGGLPMAEWKKRPGERVGNNWRVGPDQSRRARRALYDTNYWKTFVASRLRTAVGDPGAITFFGRQSNTHRCLADHLTAERSVRTEGRGRKVDQWTLADKSRDNHWFDCVVGAAVAASIRGVTLPGAEPAESLRQVGFSAMVRRRRQKVRAV